jgi:cell division protein FtsQ
MAFGKSKNRRRVDAERSVVSLKATAKRHGGAALRVFTGLGVLVVLAMGAKLGADWALTSSTFAIKQVSFSGLVRAPEGDLMRVSGLSIGQNLLQLDVGSLERAISSHPWVKSARVTRRLPSSVSIEVVEHRPAAMVSLGELYLLDDAGEPFKKLQSQDALDLPLVTGLSREEYVERSDESVARFKAALEVARAYGAARMGKLSEVRLDGGGREVALVTAAGQEVRLGEGEVGAQLERLARVRAELQKRGLVAEAIHLDNRTRPGWVTVRPMGISAAPGSRSEKTGGTGR